MITVRRTLGSGVALYGTKFTFRIDLSEFSLRSGWDNVYDFGKRIAALAAFLCVSAAMFPIWLPSQTALQYQLNENTRQIQALSSVPTEIAILKEQMADMKRQIGVTQAGVESIRSTGQWIVLGILGWMGKEIFTFLGGKFKKE